MKDCGKNGIILALQQYKGGKSMAEEQKLVIRRDENGNLCSYDAKTGEKVGSITEHGHTVDRIQEVKPKKGNK